MPLILAIEPDRRQAGRITSLARERLRVELLVVDSAERALQTLAERVPDLILTSLLLSGKDEAALDERLRQLDAAGSHVQTLMIPMLASSGRRASRKDGLLNRLRRSKDDDPPTEGGCEPGVFAAQIAEYLERAADEHASRQAMEEDRAYHDTEPTPAPDIAPIRREPAPAVEHTRQPYEFAAAPAPVSPVLEVESEFSIPTPPEPDITRLATAPDLVFDPYVARAFATPTRIVDEQSESSQTDQFVHDAAPAFAPLEPVAAIPSYEVVAHVEEFAPPVELTAPTGSVAAIDEVPQAGALGATFDEFVALEELSLVDIPTVALGEFADAIERFASEGSWDTGAPLSPADAGSVLDALEVLDEPEIPDIADFPPAPRRESKRRPAAVALEPMDEVEAEVEPAPASDFDFDGDLWMPLPVAAQRRWPTLEGPTVKATFAPGFDAPPDPGVEFASPPPPDRASGKKRKSSKPAQDEWGFFDPVQCGFAALLAKLDEVTDKE